MHMETVQHQFTSLPLNLGHEEQLTHGGNDMCGNHRIIGQIVVENYLDVRTVHTPGLRREAALLN